MDPAITIEPTTAEIGVGKTQQFETNTPNVKWTATGGLVDEGGLFTAGTVAGPGTVTVTATDGSSAKANVNIA